MDTFSGGVHGKVTPFLAGLLFTFLSFVPIPFFVFWKQTGSFFFYPEIFFFGFDLKWASGGVYYLLALWSRLVTSVPYLKGDTPSLLDEFVPTIVEGFINSRFNSVQVILHVSVKSISILCERCGIVGLGVELLTCSLTFLLFLCYELQAGFPDELSENPLDNVEVLQDHLESFPYLCRFQVKLFSSFLLGPLLACLKLQHTNLVSFTFI